jgi:hypothetical protein
VRDLYTLYFLDGCNSYDYLDRQLASGVAPSPVIALEALAGQKATYLEILREVDTSQRAVVEGEEDSGTPFPY